MPPAKLGCLRCWRTRRRRLVQLRLQLGLQLAAWEPRRSVGSLPREPRRSVGSLPREPLIVVQAAAPVNFPKGALDRHHLAEVVILLLVHSFAAGLDRLEQGRKR